MRISVIIPTYNRASFLERTLRSVLAQTSVDREIIVVDDGSTDNTEETVCSFAGVRFERQSRQGPGLARNLGWSLATGDYIAFLDSDDLWFPWTLETFRTCIGKCHYPRFVMGTHFPFYEEAELTTVERAPFTAVAYRDYLASADAGVWTFAGSMLLRRDCQPRFEAKHMIGEDLDLALHLGLEEGFVTIKQPFAYAYRKHSMRLSSPCKVAADFDITRRGILHVIQEEKGNRFPGGPARRRERLTLITSATRPSALQALRCNRPSSGFEIYCRTFFWNAALGRWKFLFGFPTLALAAVAQAFVASKMKRLKV